jgi:hypothetical protein
LIYWLVGHSLFLSIPVFPADHYAIFNRKHFVEHSRFTTQVAFSGLTGFNRFVGPAAVADLVPDRSSFPTNQAAASAFLFSCSSSHGLPASVLILYQQTKIQSGKLK